MPLTGFSVPKTESTTLQSLATSFAAVKTYSTNLYEPLQVFHTHCHRKNGLQTRNLYNRQQAYIVVKTDSLQASNRLCVIQNVVHEPLQASTKLCCRQNAFSKPLHTSNRLFGIQNGVHESPKPGNRLYCCENRLHEPPQEFHTHCHRKKWTPGTYASRQLVFVAVKTNSLNL